MTDWGAVRYVIVVTRLVVASGKNTGVVAERPAVEAYSTIVYLGAWIPGLLQK
jgi:hypothetical protein